MDVPGEKPHLAPPLVPSSFLFKALLRGGLQETLWPLAPQTLSFPPYIVPLSFQPLLLFLPHTSLFFTLVLLYNLPPSVLPLPVCRHRQKPSANMKELCSCWR